MTELDRPDERNCLLCGRRDVWDEATGDWTAATDDGERRSGDPFCIHEWDINGTHDPIRE